MLTIEQVRAAVEHDIAAVISLASELGEDDWLRPSRLPGWSIGELIAHLAWGQALAAAALGSIHRGEAVEYPMAIPAEPQDAVIRMLDDNHRQAMAGLDELGPSDLERPINMPYGTLPALGYLLVMVMEAGVHAHDVATSLGRQRTLSEDVVAATLTILPGALISMTAAATEHPAAGASIQLATDGWGMGLRYDGTSWQPDDAGAPAARIEGDPASMVLFTLGRTDGVPPTMTVTGDVSLAAALKRYAPGP